MAKCPKCGEEIDHLHYYAYELQKADFYLNEDESKTYGNWDSLCDIKGEPEYECPECGELLFTSEEEATEFLKPKQKQH
jgi:DNA-directed RNA polymerase subunit M/transcription elongation factor TFIIS